MSPKKKIYTRYFVAYEAGVKAGGFAFGQVMMSVDGKNSPLNFKATKDWLLQKNPELSGIVILNYKRMTEKEYLNNRRDYE